MYDVNYKDILSQGILVANESWPIVPCRHGWEYNMSEVPYSSIATEVNNNNKTKKALIISPDG